VHRWIDQVDKERERQKKRERERKKERTALCALAPVDTIDSLGWMAYLK
jgi:hypothetical protein